MKFRQFAVAASLITNSCGVPDAFAEPDLYKQYCSHLSGTTQLTIHPQRNTTLAVSSVEFMIEKDMQTACFVFGGVKNMTTVTPDHICVDFSDDESEPTITVLFASGYKHDVSDAYSAEALRPWVDYRYQQCAMKYGPPV